MIAVVGPENHTEESDETSVSLYVMCTTQQSVAVIFESRDWLNQLKEQFLPFPAQYCESARV